jgi:hypothetical protein
VLACRLAGKISAISQRPAIRRAGDDKQAKPESLNDERKFFRVSPPPPIALAPLYLHLSPLSFS